MRTPAMTRSDVLSWSLLAAVIGAIITATLGFFAFLELVSRNLATGISANDPAWISALFVIVVPVYWFILVTWTRKRLRNVRNQTNEK